MNDPTLYKFRYEKNLQHVGKEKDIEEKMKEFERILNFHHQHIDQLNIKVKELENRRNGFG